MALVAAGIGLGLWTLGSPGTALAAGGFLRVAASGSSAYTGGVGGRGPDPAAATALGLTVEELAGTKGVDVRTMTEEEFDALLEKEELARDELSHLRYLEAMRKAPHLRAIAPSGLPLICYEPCGWNLWRTDGEGGKEVVAGGAGAGAGGDGAPCHATCCSGCTHSLSLLTNNRLFLGEPIKFGTGATASDMFMARRFDGKAAFAKFTCIPGASSDRGYTTPSVAPRAKRRKCERKLHEVGEKGQTRTEARHSQLLELAHRRLAEECGLGHLSARAWTERVIASFPGVNTLVNQTALFIEPAGGINLNTLAGKSPGPHGAGPAILASVDPARVRLLAVHDLLLGAGDRHDENVNVHADGTIVVFDNDDALLVGERGKRTHYNSLFLTGTTFHRHLALHASKRVLDVRCYARPGSPPGTNDTSIGFDWPESVSRCMKKFAEADPRELRREFGLYHAAMAEVLQERSRDLLEVGFEGALERALRPDRELYHSLMAQGEEKGKRPHQMLSGQYGWTTYREPDPPQCERALPGGTKPRSTTTQTQWVAPEGVGSGETVWDGEPVLL